MNTMHSFSFLEDIADFLCVYLGGNKEIIRQDIEQ
nr:MAG TPA: protein of unknown function (DUF3447) [Herelleviridae sp.]